MLYALRNKKTQRFLIIDPVKEERCYRYENPYTVIVLKVYDSQYGGVIFVTDKDYIAKQLKENGKSNDNIDIVINLGWGPYKFELADIEIVELSHQMESSNAN